jgi:hypothetical protein
LAAFLAFMETTTLSFTTLHHSGERAKIILARMLCLGSKWDIVPLGEIGAAFAQARHPHCFLNFGRFAMIADLGVATGELRPGSPTFRRSR